MIARIARDTFIIATILLLAFPVHAQKKKKTTKPAIDTNAIVTDKYHGTILVADDSVYSVLQLEHKLLSDYGAFTLDETYKKPGGRILQSQTTGQWNMLKANVEDDNADIVEEDATIVQVDGSDKVLFFFKKDDSTLQKIDPQLKLLLPIENYILSRRVKAMPFKKDTFSQHEMAMRRLAGRYVGKLPCADCNAITSTLTLQCKAHAKAGDYSLSDKYIGSKNGDITNDRKGRWGFISKQVDGRNTLLIVLDNDKRGRESYYLVKKDGNLSPLDRNQQKIDAPFDQTMRKQ